MNYLLEQFGISVNNDSVVRTSFYKYFHPKEVLIQSGILNKEVVRVANGLPKEVQRQQPKFLSSALTREDDEFGKESQQVLL